MSRVLNLSDWNIIFRAATRAEKKGDCAWSLSLLKRCVGLEPPSLEPWYALARLSRQLSECQTEIEALLHTLDHEMLDPVSWGRVVYLLAESSHHRVAFHVGLRFLRAYPNNEHAALAVLDQLINNNRPKMALDFILALQERGTTSPVKLIQRLVRAYHRMGNFSEALENAQVLLDLDSHNPMSHLIVGSIYDDVGDAEQASCAYVHGVFSARQSSQWENLRRELEKRIDDLETGGGAPGRQRFPSFEYSG